MSTERSRYWPSDPGLAQRDEVLFSVGDVAVSRYWIVTPHQAVPIQGTRWVSRENTFTQHVMPGYAVVLCVVFIVFCFLGLLALALREDRVSGTVEVTITNDDGFFHTTNIIVNDASHVAAIRQSVAHAQYLAATPPQLGV